MDLSLFFAGTGGLGADRAPRAPGAAVRRGGDRLLFDCGEGTQRQLLRSVGLPGPRRDLPHAPPRRPLARPAGDAEDVRPARPRGAARRLRAARHARPARDRSRGVSGRLGYDVHGHRARALATRSSSTATRSQAFACPPPRPGASATRSSSTPRPGRFDAELARAARRRRPGPAFGRLQRGEAVDGVDARAGRRARAARAARSSSRATPRRATWCAPPRTAPTCSCTRRRSSTRSASAPPRPAPHRRARRPRSRSRPTCGCSR